MKASTLISGFAVSFALCTVTTGLAAWMAWPAFGPRGHVALAGLCFVAGMLGLTCRWLGHRATGSSSVCDQLALMTSDELPLTERFDEARQDELSSSLNDYLARIDDLIEDVRERAQEIEAGSLELNSGSHQALATAEAQAASLDTVGAAIEEVDSFLGQSVLGVRSADELARNAEAAARQASTAVQEMIATLNQQGHSSEASPRLLAKMTEIAFQADLVALNAEVEAARAGDAGKGFAAVAGAVRALAQRINDTQRDTTELVTAMTRNAESSSDIGATANAALQQAIADTVRSMEFMERVVTNTNEQAASIRKITAGVVTIGETTHSSHESARNLAHTSQETVTQVGQLTQAVESCDRC